eukprot:2316048-Prymnesium_polylepis.1
MSMRWFRVLREYEYAMHLDEDLCLERLPSCSFFSALSADYAYALEEIEPNQQVAETFDAWVREHESVSGLEQSIHPLYSTRIFITRVSWWNQPQVRRFLADVNTTDGIYSHRWYAAIIQTAAVR